MLDRQWNTFIFWGGSAIRHWNGVVEGNSQSRFGRRAKQAKVAHHAPATRLHIRGAWRGTWLSASIQYQRCCVATQEGEAFSKVTQDKLLSSNSSLQPAFFTWQAVFHTWLCPTSSCSVPCLWSATPVPYPLTLFFSEVSLSRCVQILWLRKSSPKNIKLVVALLKPNFQPKGLCLYM